MFSTEDLVGFREMEFSPLVLIAQSPLQGSGVSLVTQYLENLFDNFPQFRSHLQLAFGSYLLQPFKVTFFYLSLLNIPSVI